MKKSIIEKRVVQLPDPETLALGKASLMEILRHGATSLLQFAIEQEITEHLRRARYAHRRGEEGESTGYRNGYRDARIDTPSGTITYAKQRLAGDPSFQSKIHTPHVRRPEEFDQAVPEMSFIADMKIRGLDDPILVVSDGNPGLIAAIERYFPTSYRQRCVKHKIENVLDSVPKEKHAEVRPKLSKIFFGSTSLEQAKAALEKFVREYRKIYPQAVGRLLNDVDQALTFYLFPSSHWRRIRTSNKLERMNLEIRRRLNVIGRHPSEEGCLALVYQATKRHAERQKTFGTGDLVKKLWERLRTQKLEMITQLELPLAS